MWKCGKGRSGRSGPQPQYGVGNGARTHDTRNHNPVLCQLSYTHHMKLLLNGRETTWAATVDCHLTALRAIICLWRTGGTSFGSAERLSRRPAAALARLKGLEPLAHCLEGSCSIHLSYRRISSPPEGAPAKPPSRLCGERRRSEVSGLSRLRGSERYVACADAGAGDGNRTHATSLEGWDSTIELHPRIWAHPQISA